MRDRPATEVIFDRSAWAYEINIEECHYQHQNITKCHLRPFISPLRWLKGDGVLIGIILLIFGKAEGSSINKPVMRCTVNIAALLSCSLPLRWWRTATNKYQQLKSDETMISSMPRTIDETVRDMRCWSPTNIWSRAATCRACRSQWRTENRKA